jgi:hypothetical protein
VAEVVLAVNLEVSLAVNLEVSLEVIAGTEKNKLLSPLKSLLKQPQPDALYHYLINITCTNFARLINIVF